MALPRRGHMRKLVALAILVTNGCTVPVEHQPTGSITGRAQLVGLSDQSGIAISLVGPTTQVTVTDADGNYQFERLVAGEYLVTASARSTQTGPRSARVSLTDGADAMAEALSLVPLGSVNGKATLSGASSGNS